MLSPAPERLLVELDKLDSRERTAFENNLHSDANLGSGPYSTTFNTKCAKQDCPNKRKK
jgi:hypothetical protein